MAKILKFGTVSVELTNPDDNMTDLMNLFAQMCFSTSLTETEAKENANHVIEEQYFAAIMNSNKN